MIPLRQSTASQEIILGPFLDSTDGDTEENGLTIANTDIKLWKNGTTALVNKNSGGATTLSAGGLYYATLDATDSNTAGPMVINVHVAGALAVRLECCVYPANVYDSLFAGSDTLQVEATSVTDKTGYTVSTNNDKTGYTVSTNNDKTGYTVSTVSDKTGYSIAAGGIASGSIAAAELNNIADAGLKRDWNSVTGEASRSSLNALRFLRNAWVVAAGTLTVYQEDDATPAWTSTITSDAAADPVTGSDPA